MKCMPEEEDNIERIINEYGDLLLKICTIYLKDQSLAEDAVQEIFIKVYEKYNTFNYMSKEKTWILRIAMNTCKNYMRTSWFRYVTTAVNLESVSDDRIDIEFEKKEKYKEIMEEIGMLSQKYRDVILLYYYQELSVREVAQVLRIREGTVKVRLQRARQQLSVQLKEVKENEGRI